MKKLCKVVQKAVIEFQEAASTLAEQLQEQLSKAEEYLENRSEKWQEEKGGDYEDWISEIQQMIDTCESVAEMNGETEFQSG